MPWEQREPSRKVKEPRERRSARNWSISRRYWWILKKLDNNNSWTASDAWLSRPSKRETSSCASSRSRRKSRNRKEKLKKKRRRCLRNMLNNWELKSSKMMKNPNKTDWTTWRRAAKSDRRSRTKRGRLKLSRRRNSENSSTSTSPKSTLRNWPRRRYSFD